MSRTIKPVTHQPLVTAVNRNSIPLQCSLVESFVTDMSSDITDSEMTVCSLSWWLEFHGLWCLFTYVTDQNLNT